VNVHPTTPASTVKDVSTAHTESVISVSHATALATRIPELRTSAINRPVCNGRLVIDELYMYVMQSELMFKSIGM